MLDAQIQQGRDIIKRLEKCLAEGLEAVPGIEKVRVAESTAWFEATGGIVAAMFGEHSPECRRWQQLVDKGGTFAEDARNQDPRKPELVISGYINHHHHCIGLLNELNATYQLRRSTSTPSTSTTRSSGSVSTWFVGTVSEVLGFWGMLLLVVILSAGTIWWRWSDIKQRPGVERALTWVEHYLQGNPPAVERTHP